jgi:predicted outer membrane protein
MRTEDDRSMPSYRVTLDIAELRPGASPAAVLPTARDACRAVAQVEAADVAVTGGRARIVVRFAVTDDSDAQRVGAKASAAADRVARVTRWAVTRRASSHWIPLPTAL